MFSFLCCRLSLYVSFILRLLCNIIFPYSFLFLYCSCSLAYWRQRTLLSNYFCYNPTSVIACAEVSSHRHAYTSLSLWVNLASNETSTTTLLIIQGGNLKCWSWTNVPVDLSPGDNCNNYFCLYSALGLFHSSIHLSHPSSALHKHLGFMGRTFIYGRVVDEYTGGEIRGTDLLCNILWRV